MFAFPISNPKLPKATRATLSSPKSSPRERTFPPLDPRYIRTNPSKLLKPNYKASPNSPADINSVAGEHTPLTALRRTLLPSTDAILITNQLGKVSVNYSYEYPGRLCLHALFHLVSGGGKGSNAGWKVPLGTLPSFAFHTYLSTLPPPVHPRGYPALHPLSDQRVEMYAYHRRRFSWSDLVNFNWDVLVMVEKEGMVGL
ncbi:hypothetical protein CDAR_186421 [Caerostris darwini]|uniref:Uncharacterized protein n=1 Tax=Caerostris darwini TaxID=1538125 RepID=A0AAV4V1E4_9ARAC|nr:hypothetical protein CDAR_186421 [Caerostris darwini]